MIGDKEKFKNFGDYDGGSVRFGNNEPCCIKRRGRIYLTKELVCDNPYWVEGLKHNLLSVAQLINIGFKVEFMHGKARLLNEKGNLIGSEKKTKVAYSISNLVNAHDLLLNLKKVGYGIKYCVM